MDSIGGLADDGKRSQAVDVLYQCRRQHFLLFFLYRGGVRGGENHTGLGSIGRLADFCLGS